MPLKFIQQNVTTLHEAYNERKAEYDALRAAGRWSGAVLYAGTLLELALKLLMCKHEDFTFREFTRSRCRMGANAQY